jgi:hypothetical protein
MAVSSEPMRRDEDGPRQTDLDVGEANAWNHDVEAQSLGQPDEAGDDREGREVLEPDRPEDALLEAFVELEDPRAGAGGRTRIRRPKLRIVNRPMAATDHRPRCRR